MIREVIQGTLINDAINRTPEAEEPSDTSDEPAKLIVADTGELIEQPSAANGEQEQTTSQEETSSDTLDEAANANKENNAKREEDAQNNTLSQSSPAQPTEE